MMSKTVLAQHIVMMGRVIVKQHLVKLAAITISLAILISTNAARAREFGGHDCSNDCSGHAAGYRWAEAHTITDDSDCPLRGGALSFYEGCLVYVEDPSRGADEDDDGDDID